jgi:hypothetical protein
MAVLATLEEAQVLPPEGTREANLIIKSVIQCQSAFMKSEDPAIQEFLARAVAAKHGDRAPDVIALFRSSGWTSDVLQALAEAAEGMSVDRHPGLRGGLARYNVSAADFQQLMGLVREAQRSLAIRGLDFRQVYAAHRNDMPGAAGP